MSTEHPTDGWQHRQAVIAERLAARYDPASSDRLVYDGEQLVGRLTHRDREWNLYVLIDGEWDEPLESMMGWDDDDREDLDRFAVGQTAYLLALAQGND